MNKAHAYSRTKEFPVRPDNDKPASFTVHCFKFAPASGSIREVERSFPIELSLSWRINYAQRSQNLPWNGPRKYAKNEEREKGHRDSPHRP